jgi:hypothetical protein
MAEATFNVLQKAAPTKSSTDWKNLAAEVERFAKAKSKWAKDAWFQKPEFKDRSFLQYLSLPNCDKGTSPCRWYPFDKVIEQWRRVLTTHKPPVTTLPLRMTTFFQQVFEALVAGDVSTLQSQFIDMPLARMALARAMHINEPCPQLMDTLSEFIMGRLFRDGRGGHQPLLMCEKAAELHKRGPKGISCQEAVAAAAQGVAEALSRSPPLEGLLNQIKPSPPFVYHALQKPESESYVAFGRFVHLSSDLLILEARFIDGKPKVTSLTWAPRE